MISYGYLRPQKADCLKKLEDAAFPCIEVGFQDYDNATILPLRKTESGKLLFGKGGVVDAHGDYIEKSGLASRFEGSYSFDDALYRDESVVYCGLFVRHWGHFLVESVSRLWYFLEHDDGVSKYVFVIEESTTPNATGNFFRFFELLGIADRVEFINRPTRFKTVIVPELAYFETRYHSNQHKNIFETVAKNALAINPIIQKTDKIYFSRGHFRKALNSEIGHDFLEQYFKSNGYKILYPEELTLEEMICYIRNANVCATPSGTLPHNYLFAQDGKKVIIIERTALVNEIQVDVDRIKNLDVTYIDGHWMVYPGASGSGPFLYGYTQEFEKFTNDFNYLPPRQIYVLEKYKKQSLKNFIKTHRACFAYDWGMEKWATIYAKAIYEAHEATVQEFFDYIRGIKPFMFKHYFQLNYIKKIIKQLLLKNRG